MISAPQRKRKGALTASGENPTTISLAPGRLISEVRSETALIILCSRSSYEEVQRSISHFEFIPACQNVGLMWDEPERIDGVCSEDGPVRRTEIFDEKVSSFAPDARMPTRDLGLRVVF